MPEQHKILFTGTMGAGKTTAIKSVSAVKMVTTEAANTDMGLFAKATTTVGLDYGEVTLPDGSVLRLYGTPGQGRFEFMWKIVARGALGVVILVDNSRPDPIADMNMYLDNFRRFADAGAVVIGVGRSDTHPTPRIEDFCDDIASKGWALPVVEADARRGEDVLMLLDTLFNSLELAENQVQEEAVS